MFPLQIDISGIELCSQNYLSVIILFKYINSTHITRAFSILLSGHMPTTVLYSERRLIESLQASYIGIWFIVKHYNGKLV